MAKSGPLGPRFSGDQEFPKLQSASTKVKGVALSKTGTGVPATGSSVPVSQVNENRWLIYEPPAVSGIRDLGTYVL